jgi:hypothetical protein
METIRDVYKRFKQNYHTETGGINLYPQFDSDLKIILNWVEDNLVDSDEPIWDCAWSKPYGEDD